MRDLAMLITLVDAHARCDRLTLLRNIESLRATRIVVPAPEEFAEDRVISLKAVQCNAVSKDDAC